MNDLILSARRESSTGNPPDPKDVLELLAREDAFLVNDVSGLSRCIHHIISQHWKRLSGKQDRLKRVLWNRTKEDGELKFRPVDEEGFSDEIQFCLEQAKEQRLFVGREVQYKKLGRGEAAAGLESGARIDIEVTVLSKLVPESALKAIIEVKGSWNKELVTAMGDQLLKDYLQPKYHIEFQGVCGIYLIAWFQCEVWDSEDTRKGQTNSNIIKALGICPYQIIPDGKAAIKKMDLFFTNQANQISESQEFPVSVMLFDARLS